MSSNAPRELSLRLTGPASWRLVVRRSSGVVPGPTAGPQPALLSYDQELEEELVSVVDETTEGAIALPGATGRLLREVGSVPGRERYVVRVSCGGGGSIRYVLGDEIDGEFITNTETQVRCDTDHDGQSDAHEAILAIPQPNGSRVYVAADPATRFSLLITGDPPPVALVREEPGWQLSAGFGPDLAFETNTHAFTGPGVEGGGPVLIAVSCAGTGTIEILVTLQHTTEGPVTETSHAQFDAQCTPDGARTSQSFPDADDYVDVELTTSAGTWVAVSILVPDPLPTPD